MISSGMLRRNTCARKEIRTKGGEKRRQKSSGDQSLGERRRSRWKGGGVDLFPLSEAVNRKDKRGTVKRLKRTKARQDEARKRQTL